MSDKVLRLISLDELDKEIARREALPITDLENPYGFERDEIEGCWDVWWGGYCYWISNDRIDTQEKLLAWVEHMAGKTWEGMTPNRIAEFIDAVRQHNKWPTPGL